MKTECCCHTANPDCHPADSRIAFTLNPRPSTLSRSASRRRRRNLVFLRNEIGSVDTGRPEPHAQPGTTPARRSAQQRTDTDTDTFPLFPGNCAQPVGEHLPESAHRASRMTTTRELPSASSDTQHLRHLSRRERSGRQARERVFGCTETTSNEVHGPSGAHSDGFTSHMAAASVRLNRGQRKGRWDQTAFDALRRQIE